MEKFSELVYTRPSLEETESQLRKQLEIFRNAGSYAEEDFPILPAYIFTSYSHPNTSSTSIT